MNYEDQLNVAKFSLGLSHMVTLDPKAPNIDRLIVDLVPLLTESLKNGNEPIVVVLKQKQNVFYQVTRNNVKNNSIESVLKNLVGKP